MTWILELADKCFETTFVNIFKDLKKNIVMINP